MAARKQQSGGAKRSNGARSRGESRNAVSRASSNKLSSDQLEGREPSHEPDVFIDIRKVKVDEVYVDVEHLEAHLALRAKLANLLQVVAGVHVSLGKVEVDITGVEAEALLKVRLENLYDILDRALTTLDRNPEILESLVKTVDDTVGSVGDLGEQALGPGGAVTETLGDVGQAAQQVVQPGGAASQAVGGLTDAAGQALGPGGAVGQIGGSLGQAVGGARETLENAATKIGGPISEKISALAEKVGSDDAGEELPAPAQAGRLDDAKREQDRQQREQRRQERRGALEQAGPS
jgi:hypothetical protein